MSSVRAVRAIHGREARMRGPTTDLMSSVAGLLVLADELERSARPAMLGRDAMPFVSEEEIPDAVAADVHAREPLEPLAVIEVPLTPTVVDADAAARLAALADGLETVRRLEDLRAEINDLTGKRLGPRSRRRLSTLLVEERTILDLLGFDSYLDVILNAATGNTLTGATAAPTTRPPSNYAPAGGQSGGGGGSGSGGTAASSSSRMAKLSSSSRRTASSGAGSIGSAGTGGGGDNEPGAWPSSAARRPSASAAPSLDWLMPAPAVSAEDGSAEKVSGTTWF